MWQDYVIAGAQVIASFALVPMILDKEKPTLLASIPTATALAVIAVALFSLGLLLSTIIAGTASFLWLVLALQRLRSWS